LLGQLWEESKLGSDGAEPVISIQRFGALAEDGRAQILKVPVLDTTVSRLPLPITAALALFR